MSKYGSYPKWFLKCLYSSNAALDSIDLYHNRISELDLKNIYKSI